MSPSRSATIWETCASIGRSRPGRSGSCAARLDTYTTDNAFVEQATLPSTGATWHSNYMNLVLGQQFIFSPTWLGTFTLGGSGLRLNEYRNSELGFALAFPFSSTSQTISGFETFGDNQFVTPITAFPIARDQEKYQVHYAVTHSTGRHCTQLRRRFHSRAGDERRASRRTPRTSLCSRKIRWTTSTTRSNSPST